MVTPLGNDLITTWNNIKEGNSGVAYTTIFDASKFPTKFLAEVKDFDVNVPGDDPANWVNRGRHTKFGESVHQAVMDSGLMWTLRFGIYLEPEKDFSTSARL